MNTWILQINPLAATWLAAIWRACWQGGLAFLLVWALCRAFHRLPAWAKSWLWRLAYVKLLVAFVCATPIALPLLPAKSLQSAPQAQLPAATATVEIPSPAISLAAQAAPNPPISSATTRALPSQLPPAPPVHILPSTAGWLLLIWSLGVGTFGICAWRDLLRARLLLRGCAPVTNPALLECAAELARSLRLPAVPSLMMTDAISSPLLLAGARPVIVLPSALATGSTLPHLRLMIAHEMAHLKRFDLWWVWLAVVGEGLFFFHPIVWLARREWRLTQEMACDEMVVRLTRVPASTYGDMLVGVAALKLSKRLEPLLVTVGLTETKEMLARRLNAMKTIKLNSTKRMALATAIILIVGAVSVLPWRLVAQQAPSAAATAASPNSGQAPGAGISDPSAAGPNGASTGVSGGGGGFGGGGGMRRGGFAAGLGPASPPPTDVAPARFEATVYELEIPENRIADLDAAKLESAAATPQALAAALGAFGTPKILYKVDQTVNLYGENITLGTQEPMITGTSQRPTGGPVNSISYTSIGLVARISATAPPNNSSRGDLTPWSSAAPQSTAPPNNSSRGDPNVRLNFQLSVMADSGVAISENANANRIRNVQLSQSGTPKFGKPSILVTVNAASAGEKSRPVAYIVRYLFTQPKP